MLTIEQLSVQYPDGTQGIDKVSFTLPPNQNVALIGANGAGKTTLLLALVGILASTGKVTVQDTVLTRHNLPEIRDKIGMVFQNPDDQLFMPTVYQDIAFGLPLENQKQRVQEILDALGIASLRDKTALKLSGGEKRMAALASVLAMQPSVLLLDEPTAFLDPKARRILIQTLQRLPQTKLIATHDLTFALEVCPRSILLRNGQLFADGMSRTLLFDEVCMEQCGVEAIQLYQRGGLDT